MPYNHQNLTSEFTPGSSMYNVKSDIQVEDIVVGEKDILDYGKKMSQEVNQMLQEVEDLMHKKPS